MNKLKDNGLYFAIQALIMMICAIRLNMNEMAKNICIQESQEVYQ